MINKIIKITIAQIMMWAAACLVDVIQFSANAFIQTICFFIAPLFILVGYFIMWTAIHSFDKKDGVLLKWIAQYVIFLVVWWLETYGFVIGSDKLIEADKWITPKEGFLPGLIYGWWGLLVVTLVTVAVIMHILCTVIKCFNNYEILHKIINGLLEIGMIVLVIFGETAVSDKGWGFFAVAILAGFACFFFNWCYYKVQ